MTTNSISKLLSQFKRKDETVKTSLAQGLFELKDIRDMDIESLHRFIPTINIDGYQIIRTSIFEDPFKIKMECITQNDMKRKKPCPLIIEIECLPPLSDRVYKFNIYSVSLKHASRFHDFFSAFTNMMRSHPQIEFSSIHSKA